MNDRFKFRLFDKSTSEMSYDVCIGFIKDGGVTENWVCADTTCGQINYIGDKLKDIELMQSTGLKDKTQKLIYEGDIVYLRLGISTRNVNHYIIYKGIIAWEDLKGGYILKPEVNPRMPADCASFGEVDASNCEVLGNIYTNPEVLELTHEICPYCNCEVQIPKTMEYHKCPECGAMILPCNACPDMNCAHCKYEKREDE